MSGDYKGQPVEPPPIVDLDAAGREPWPPDHREWGPVPLDAGEVKEMGQRAAYWKSMWPKLSARGARSAYFDLVRMVELLCEDYAAYDIVEPPSGRGEEG